MEGLLFYYEITPIFQIEGYSHICVEMHRSVVVPVGKASISSGSSFVAPPIVDQVLLFGYTDFFTLDELKGQ